MSEHSLKNCSALLKENGIKPSFQRVKIMEFLQNHYLHPTVNEIYDALIGEIPSLSKTTVYNTLNLMKEHSLVNVLMISDTEARYDTRLETHGHFFCKCCKSIRDIDINLQEELLSGVSQCNVDTIEVNVTGICEKCKEKSRT